MCLQAQCRCTLFFQQTLARGFSVARPLRMGACTLCLNLTNPGWAGGAPGELLGTPRTRRVRSACDSRGRGIFRLVLALLQISLMLRGAAAAQCVLAGAFARVQCRTLFARLPTDAAQAAADGEALVAGRLLRRQPLFNSGVLLLEMLLAVRAFGRPVLSQRRAGRPCQQQGHAEKPTQDVLHVSPVSTTRRSRARNSRDCISLRRETVRGNS